ncbi:MAG: carboxypeptidase-like regulatory domain-containing protein, partial [Planctomycetota bacterium]|nr:carboxypeptidase-like regulatory domain-containing protein [Planctomycetota bacterium]
MKPSIVLLAVALVLGGLVSIFLFGGGDSTTEEIARADDNEILVPTGLDRGPASLVPEPAAEEAGTEREAVIDRAAAKAAREEERVAAARAKGPFLLGRVYDSQGFAVPNASVTLSASGPAGVFLQLGPTGYLEKTTTDANGAFKAPSAGLFGDTVDVRVRGKGFLAFDEELELPPNKGDQQVPVIELERGVVLAGTVVDSEGLPVEGAEVTRTTVEQENRFERNVMFGGGGGSRGSGKVVTDAEGRFVLGNEPEGDYVVLVTHESYPKGRIEGSAPYAGYEDNGLVVRLAPTAAIVGRIEGFPPGRKYVDVHAVPTELARDEELDGPAAIFMAAGLAKMHSVSVES